jgi:hypothetical protein
MFRRNECESNIKSRIQGDDFENNAKKHLILICLVNAINDQDLSIQRRHSLTNDSCKEKLLQ